MKKILSMLFIGAIAMNVMAKCYYCSPTATDAKVNGSSWDKAITIANLKKALGAGIKDGDTIYIKGGTIRFTTAADRWDISKSVTLIGGFDPDAKGTVTSLPTYPSNTPTILSGDINNNGQPDHGDAPALIRVNYEAATDKVVTIQGIDFTNTYYDAEEESAEDLQTYMAECAALRLICGTAFVKNCHFDKHVTPINRGSQCVTVVGAKIHMTDCELHDCTCLSRGGLLRLRNYFIGKNESKTIEPAGVVERCAFYNGNAMGGPIINTEGRYGGAIHLSAGTFLAINSTIVFNTIYTNGGGIRGNTSGTALISCTIGNNVALRSDDPTAEKRNTYGGSIATELNAKLRIVNTFVIDDKDNGTKQYAPYFSDGNPSNMENVVLSSGYNVVGTFYYLKGESGGGTQITDQSKVWKTTDITSTAGSIQNFATYFGGEHRFMDNGGCSKTILPLQMQNGASVAELQALADQWCPSWTKVDASVDQRGYKRDANVTCRGAAAFEAAPSAIEEISQSAISNQQSAIFNLMGQPVDENYKGVVIYKGQKYLIR